MQRDTARAASATAARPRAALILMRAWPALPAITIVLFVLLRLAFDNGGYFPGAFTSAGAIAMLTLAVLVLRPPQRRYPTHGLLAAGALAAFACWSGLSRAWSVVPDAPLLDMQRTILYLALFGLALLAADSGRHARLLIWGVVGVIIAVVGAGLLSRLQPDILSAPMESTTSVFYRLDYPLGYWNAFGGLAALGGVLAVGLAADRRAHLGLRSSTAAIAVLLLVGMYLSLSRGAWLALIAGVVILVAISPRRGSLLLTLAIVGGATGVAILRLRGYPALVTNPAAGVGQQSQGDAFTLELLALAVAAAAAQAAIIRVAGIEMIERNARHLRRIALTTGAVVLLLAAVVGYAVKGGEAEGGVTTAFGDAAGWVERQWGDFLDPVASAPMGTGRLVTAKGARSDGYRVAIDGFRAHPLIGGGAGSFEVRYVRDRKLNIKIRDAHSLPLQTLSELGAVGLALLLGFLVALAAGARRALAGKGALRPAEAAAVSAAFVVWLGHASIDWDWEMPALTAAAVVIGATLTQGGRRRRRSSGPVPAG